MDVSQKDDVKNFLKSVFKRQRKTFKIQISMGLLLKNWKTEEMIYWHPWNTSGTNTDYALKKPRSIVNTATANDLLADLSIEKLYETAKTGRETSDWVCHMITNLSVFVTHLNQTFEYLDLIAHKPPRFKGKMKRKRQFIDTEADCSDDDGDDDGNTEENKRQR